MLGVPDLCLAFEEEVRKQMKTIATVCLDRLCAPEPFRRWSTWQAKYSKILNIGDQLTIIFFGKDSVRCSSFPISGLLLKKRSADHKQCEDCEQTDSESCQSLLRPKVVEVFLHNMYSQKAQDLYFQFYSRRNQISECVFWILGAI